MELNSVKMRFQLLENFSKKNLQKVPEIAAGKNKRFVEIIFFASIKKRLITVQ